MQFLLSYYIDLLHPYIHSDYLHASHSRVDPAQEISRLRHSINLLEAHIFPNQRSHLSETARRPSDASNSIVPKKEALDPDVADKATAAPGMLGGQSQGGLYAGPTSAATHLLLVSTHPFSHKNTVIRCLMLISSE